MLTSSQSCSCRTWSPADQYARGLITEPELETARPVVVHLACPVGRRLAREIKAMRREVGIR